MSVYHIENLYTFISTGEKVAMYTLRVMNRYNCTNIDGKHYSFIDSQFIRILSNDKAKAETLAVEFSENQGFEFRGNAEFELNEIRRKNSAAKAEELEEQNRIKIQYQKEEDEKFERVLNEGVLNCGKYHGKTIEEIIKIDMPYVFWLAKQLTEDKTLFNANAKLAADYLENNEIYVSKHIGEIGDFFEGNVTVINKTEFQGNFGMTWVVSCLTENKDNITFYTTSKKLLNTDISETMKIKGMISRHSEYNGIPQTTLKAPKIVK